MLNAVWTAQDLIGDFDGDGACDYLVATKGGLGQAALTVDDAPQRVPAAFIAGVRSFSARPDDLEEQRYQLSYGRRLSSADIDGDGRRDLVLAQPGYDEFGEPLFDGIGSVHAWRWREGQYQPHATLTGPASFAASLSDALDYDGDGLEDVAVSDPELGRTFVIRGGHAQAWSTLDAGIAAGIVVELETSDLGPLAGWSLVSLGDVDLDGRDDLLVATADSMHLFQGGSTKARLEFEPEQPQPLLGVAGDFDADGAMDVAIGEPNQGRVTLMYGSRDLPRGTLQLSSIGQTHPQLVGIEDLQGFGPCVDHDRDGRADLWVVGSDELWLVYGSLPVGPTNVGVIGSDADMGATGFVVTKQSGDTVIGEAVGSCDLDGDGHAESLVSVARDKQQVPFRMESMLILHGGKQ